MAAPVVTVSGSFIPDNSARLQRFIGTLTIGNSAAIYPNGGIPIQAALAAALSPKSSAGPVAIYLYSTLASGYVYTYESGNLVIMTVPPSGSLTSGAPLTPLTSIALGAAIAADVIGFDAYYDRNL